jgi:hypothetical protein
VPAFTGLSWGPEGTGSAPNSNTIFGGGNECAYQVSATINQNGSCTFSGYYQNRGDVPWGTAPPQGFVVAFLVYDTTGKVYSLSYAGVVPSAPQNGSLVTWNVTQTCPIIAENWYSIAAKNHGGTYVWNTYDETVWQVIGSWFSAAASDIETAVSDFIQAMGPITGDDGGDDGDDTEDIVVRRATLPPLPAGTPTGAAATGHQAGPQIAGIHK